MSYTIASQGLKANISTQLNLCMRLSLILFNCFILEHSARRYLQLPLQQWDASNIYLLVLSYKLKGKHCQKSHCWVVDTFWQCLKKLIETYNTNPCTKVQLGRKIRLDSKISSKAFYTLTLYQDTQCKNGCVLIYVIAVLISEFSP